MISHICPVCKTENSLNLNFFAKEYVCKSCSALVNVSSGKSRTKLKEPNWSAVLKPGMKGTLEGTEYTVAGVVVRKYGNYHFGGNITLKTQWAKMCF